MADRLSVAGNVVRHWRGECSLHWRGECRVCLSHTHTTCRRVIVPLFNKRLTQCEWQHWVRDTAGTFAND